MSEEEIYYPLDAVRSGVVCPFAECTSIHSNHPRDRYMEDRGRFVSQMAAAARAGGARREGQMRRKDDV